MTRLLRSRPRPSLAASLLLSLLAACSSGGAAHSSTSSGTGSGSGGGGIADDTPVGGDRPASVYTPSTYTHGTPVPLVIMLHGYTASGDLEEYYLNIRKEAEARGFLYVHPDGTPDGLGARHWNATDACCGSGGPVVDDSAYVESLIVEIKSRFSVDPKRVYLMGHSNGGFMSYRMACDHADSVAAIASLAGGMWSDVSKCKPSGPVGVLEIHGTSDETVAYGGGAFYGHAYPGAQTTVEDWVALDGCSTTPDTSAPPLDLEVTLPGAETTVTRYETGCKPGGGAELWSINGGKHLPAISKEFIPRIVDFLYAHPKP